MKIANCFRPSSVAIALLTTVASFSVYGSAETSDLIGTGEPGLKIIYKSTNQFVVYLDEPWTVGPGLAGGYDKRHIDVLLDHRYGLKQKIQTGSWHDIPAQLYCFDERIVFTCEGGAWNSVYKSYQIWPRDNRVFTLNGGEIVVSKDVYQLARHEYGLTSNQLFLGKIGTNVFFWEPPELRKVFFRPVSEKIATNYFELPSGMMDLFGVTKSVKKDIGFPVLKKSGWFSYTPAEYAFVEVWFKNAKLVKSK
jgi:hypothetical protein